MSGRHFAFWWRTVASLALSMSVVLPAVSAEDAAQITVTASRPSTKAVGQTPRGASVEESTLHKNVSYADLDLNTAKGVRALKARVRDAARSSCKELEMRDPVPAPGAKACFSAAVDSATAQVNAAIAAAVRSKAPTP